MTPPGAHDFTIGKRTEKVFMGHPVRYRAECQGCGFVGEWRRSEDEAEGDGLAHQAMAAPPDLDEGR